MIAVIWELVYPKYRSCPTEIQVINGEPCRITAEQISASHEAPTPLPRSIEVRFLALTQAMAVRFLA